MPRSTNANVDEAKVDDNNGEVNAIFVIMHNDAKSLP